MITKNKNEIEKKLQELVSKIAIPSSKYEEAKSNYESVGNWLSEENSALSKYAPQIYPQGSFALGTAIIPLEDCDHDVDAICLLQMTTDDTTQEQLKELVGERLKENSMYKRMLDPQSGGRRCWTLKYSDARNFHIDILPAIPCNRAYFNNIIYRTEIENKAIYITDKQKDTLSYIGSSYQYFLKQNKKPNNKCHLFFYGGIQYPLIHLLSKIPLFLQLHFFPVQFIHFLVQEIPKLSLPFR